MHIAYFDSEWVLLGYAETFDPDIDNGTTNETEWPGSAYRRVFSYRPDNQPGLYYWDVAAGAFASIARKPRPAADAGAELQRAALAARSRGEILPPDVMRALEAFIVPVNRLPSAS